MFHEEKTRKKKSRSDKSEKYRDMCFECGKKRYTPIRDLGMITVSGGDCIECGKNAGIIPARDWRLVSQKREPNSAEFD